MPFCGFFEVINPVTTQTKKAYLSISLFCFVVELAGVYGGTRIYRLLSGFKENTFST